MARSGTGAPGRRARVNVCVRADLVRARQRRRTLDAPVLARKFYLPAHPVPPRATRLATGRVVAS